MVPDQKLATLQTACWFCSSAIFTLLVVMFLTQLELAGGHACKLGFTFLYTNLSSRPPPASSVVNFHVT